MSDPSRLALAAALRAHLPADEEEARHVATVLSVVESSPDCFSRGHFAPGHVTGSAFVVCPRRGEVLLHHHRRLGRWLQLGGHDDGERDPAATALREAREESGLADLVPIGDGILDVDVHGIPPGRGEPAHLHLDVRYALATASPGALRRDEAESLDLGWFALDEAERRMGEPGAARALARLGRLLGREPGRV